MTMVLPWSMIAFADLSAARNVGPNKVSVDSESRVYLIRGALWRCCAFSNAPSFLPFVAPAFISQTNSRLVWCHYDLQKNQYVG
jgi:hypothetical protein